LKRIEDWCGSHVCGVVVYRPDLVETKHWFLL
jgi:hypothetical protein